MNEYLPIPLLAIYGFSLIATLFNSIFLSIVYTENKNSKEQFYHEREIFYYIVYSAGAFVFLICELELNISGVLARNLWFHRIQMVGLTVCALAMLRLPNFVFDKPSKYPWLDPVLTVLLAACVPFFFTNLTIGPEPHRIGHILQGTETTFYYVIMIFQFSVFIFSIFRAYHNAVLKIRTMMEKTGLTLSKAVVHLKSNEKFLLFGYLIIFVLIALEFLKVAGFISHRLFDVLGIALGMTVFSLLVTILQTKEFRMTVNRLIEIRKSIYDKVRGIEDEYKQLLETIVDIQERDDEYTAGHSRRVMEYSQAIAKAMGLSAEEIARVSTAGILHDIGKVGIDKSILNKPSKLTPQEFGEVAKHSKLGSDIISPHEAFGEIAKYVLYHHEKLDGTGYPEGLSEKDIPQIAKILSVADIFDALNSKRPYREELSKEKCLDIMSEMARQKKIDAEVFAKLAAIMTLR